MKHLNHPYLTVLLLKLSFFISVFLGLEKDFDFVALQAQETQQNLDFFRQKKGFYFLPQIQSTSQSFSAGKDNRLKYSALQSSIQLGGEYWDSDQRGLWFKGNIGLPSQIASPQYGNFQLNQHQISMGASYRVHFNENLLSSALSFSLGFRALFQNYAQQKTILFVDKKVFSPELDICYELNPSKSLWLRLRGGIGLPLLVRENQADSGELVNFFSYHSAFEFAYLINQSFAIQLNAEYYSQSLAFNGVGSRIPGIQGALQNDQMIAVNLGLRYMY